MKYFDFNCQEIMLYSECDYERKLYLGVYWRDMNETGKIIYVLSTVLFSKNWGRVERILKKFLLKISRKVFVF